METALLIKTENANLNRGVTAVGDGEVRKKKKEEKKRRFSPNTHSVNRVDVQPLTGKSVHLGQRGDTRGIIACYSIFSCSPRERKKHVKKRESEV